MKKIIPLSLGFLALSLATLSGFKHSHFEVARAYDKASLPTTIDLNKVDDSDVRSYYANLNSLADSEKTGTNLLKNLKPILKNGQKYYQYDDNAGKDIWKMYEITDRDWDKSPASEISGYNASTNIITGYSYGESESKKGTNPYIHALYVNRDVDNKVRAWAVEDGSRSSHGDNAEWCIDREHIWPKSHGFEDKGKGGARGDPMHLWAGDSYVNSDLHNNYYYGYVDTTKSYKDGKDKYSYDAGNLRGTSKTLGGSVTVFEPQDSDKGDIARAVFYMVARYNDLAGDDTIDCNNPNLELVDDLSAYQSSGYASTSSKTGKLGILSDLLEWNRIDPVDDYEIRRNDLLFKNFTNNRNPFIDFPQWADLIWGEDKGTVYANPQSDAINDSAIVLKDFKPTITVDEEIKFTAIVDGGANIEWTIEDPTIATIEQNETGTEVTIKPVKTGSTKLTAKTIVGGDPYEKIYNIKVVTKSAENNDGSILGKILGNKTLLIIVIVAVVLVVVVVIVFLSVASKKQKKKAKKTVKKVFKNATKGSKGKK